jgi:phosphoglycolate phosphatase/putative hydrolase of the HAD superfamily
MNSSMDTAADPFLRIPAGLKAIIFDLDGTLYRQRPLQFATSLRFFRQYWYRPKSARRTARAIRAYLSAPDTLRNEVLEDHEQDLPALHLKRASQLSGLPEDYVRECARRWIMEEPLGILPRYLHDSLNEVLNEFRSVSLKLAVFSDYPAAEKLSALGVRHFFDLISSAHDREVGRFKPDPRGLLLSMEKLGVSAAETLYVGDRQAIDGVAAERAGVAFAVAGDGHPRPSSSFRELLAAVKTKNCA